MRKQFLRKKSSAIKIQTIWVSHLAFVSFTRIRNAALIIQRSHRRLRSREESRNAKLLAIVRIQSIFRRLVAQKKFEKRREMILRREEEMTIDGIGGCYRIKYHLGR